MNASFVRRLTIALLALGLAGCSTTDETIVEFPAFVGKRVVYVADADASDAGPAGDEVYVADTGSLAQTITRIDGVLTAPAYADLPMTLGTTGLLAYRVVEDPTDGCPSNLRLLGRAGGPTTTFFSGHCVHGVASNAAGDRFVAMATVGTTGTNIYVGDPNDPSVVYQINTGIAATPGTVTQFAVEPSAEKLVFADAAGIWTADLSLPLGAIAQSPLNADQPTRLFPTSNGLSVVYTPVGDERYKFQPLAGGAATFLTNALAGGDLLDRTADGARLASTGAQLLYAVTIGGVKQLWRVAIATPLGEARADAAASLLLQSGHSFEFSPDGSSYAWVGDDGTGPAVFQSTVNAPGNVVTLTPVGEEPTGAIRWADGSTIAYLSSDADQAVPVGANALRTVNTGSPLATTLMGPAETAGSIVDRVTTCSDGTLVYDQRSVDIAGAHTALYQADPQVAASATRISPEIVATGDEIFAFSCVD